MNNEIIGNFFSTPIYQNVCRSENIYQVQAELDQAFDDLKNNAKFENRSDWNSLLLSDKNFSKDLTDDYHTHVFKKEIEHHAMNYLTYLGFPFENKLPLYKMECWMTFMRKGSYAHIHSHGRADIAGVYYYLADETDANIFFVNPVKQMGQAACFEHLDKRLSVSPKIGKILLFPGWLEHGVETSTSDKERASISFNIRFVKNLFGETTNE